MRTWMMVLSAGVLAGLTWIAGCGSSDDEAEPTPPGPMYPDVAAYCNARARAECSEQTVGNCASPSTEICVAKRQMACAKTIPAGKSYRPGEAEPCVEAVEAAYVDAIVSQEERVEIADSCAALFETESGVTGSSCETDSDCRMSEDYRCVFRVDAAAGKMKGVCQIPKLVAAGHSCEAVDAQCEAGLYCNDGPHCVTVGAAGSACSATKPCGEGLKCDAGEGKCIVKAANGSACESDDDCFEGFCNVGEVRICAARMILSPSEPICAEFR